MWLEYPKIDQFIEKMPENALFQEAVRGIVRSFSHEFTRQREYFLRLSAAIRPLSAFVCFIDGEGVAEQLLAVLCHVGELDLNDPVLQ